MEVLKYNDIKGLDASAVTAKVAEIRRELFNLKMQHAAAGLEKPHLIKIAKKNIARLLTVKNSQGDK